MHGNGTKEKNCAICSRVQRYAGQSYGRTRLKDIDNAFRKEILSGKSVGRCDFGMRDWIRDDIHQVSSAFQSGLLCIYDKHTQHSKFLLNQWNKLNTKPLCSFRCQASCSQQENLM